MPSWGQFVKAISEFTFPDRDEQWKDADSLQLLSRVMWLAHERGLRIVNLDATVMLEEPKLRPYMLSMRENIAATLGVELGMRQCESKNRRGIGRSGTRAGNNSPGDRSP